MSKIYFVRHGTPENGGRPVRFRGQTQAHLTQYGLNEASSIGHWLHSINFEGTIVSSPLPRAAETAREIAGQLGWQNDYKKKNEIVYDSRLMEIDTGDWEGLTKDEARQNNPEVFDARGIDLYHTSLPGGESFEQLGKRITNAINDMLSDCTHDYVVVSHSGAIRSFLVEQGFISPDNVMKPIIPYASYTLLSSDKKNDGIGYSFCLSGLGIKPESEIDDSVIGALYKKYDVPDNIIRHMKAVADFQDSLLSKLNNAGYNYDRVLLKKAALLHDIAKTQPRHAMVGAELLAKEGYKQLSKIVAGHHSPDIPDDFPSRALSNDEILFYSDRRIHEDTVVGLKERFDASFEKCKCAEAVNKHALLYKKSQLIEKKIETMCL